MDRLTYCVDDPGMAAGSPWRLACGSGEDGNAMDESLWLNSLDPAPLRPFLLARATERQGQCAVLREIFGNPFRFFAVDPHCLAWNDGCVPKMAQVLYDERRFAELPILADALLDAGCQDEDVLEHLRSGGAHNLGCWA